MPCVLIAALLGVGLLLTFSLEACGGTARRDAAFTIADRPTDESIVAHWMAVIAGEVTLKAGQPPEEPPQPPSFSGCIAYLRRFPEPRNAHSGTPELKAECELLYAKEKLKALYFLIPYQWVMNEAKRLGILIRDGAVKREQTRLEAAYPSAALKHALVGSSGTEADLLMRLRLAMAVKRIQDKLERGGAFLGLSPERRGASLRSFGASFLSRWTAKTTCAAGFTVPLCAGHEASKEPFSLVPTAVPLTDMTAR